MNKEIIPAIFVTDFGPFPAVENDDYTAALAKLGRELPKPKAIVVMSGHWEARGEVEVGAAKTPGISHDYSGFPDAFYKLSYPCPGDPVLAGEIVRLLLANGIKAIKDRQRPLDHGAWVPLSRIYPSADIPVIQITTMTPEENLRIGQVLYVLRERGVLLVGAGAVSHNLRLALVHEKEDPLDPWAVEFDNWLEERLDNGKTKELLNYRKLAPSAKLAAPTSEHFNPLFFALGASAGKKPENLYRSIRYANGIMRIMLFNA